MVATRSCLVWIVLGLTSLRADGQQRRQSPRVLINEIMADPAAVPDQRGEWIELYNPGRRPIDLRGYSIVSGGGPSHVIARSLIIAPDSYAVLARVGDPRSNGGIVVHYSYGASLSLANGRDWIALRDPTGATIDSVAWRTVVAGASWGVRDPTIENASVDERSWVRATTTYGLRDRGTPGRPNGGSAQRRSDVAAVSGADSAAGIAAEPDTVAPSPLVVRVLDVGQGDAIYVSNGTSKVLVDGGPEPARLGHLLDSLSLTNTTIILAACASCFEHRGGFASVSSSRTRTLRLVPRCPSCATQSLHAPSAVS